MGVYIVLKQKVVRALVLEHKLKVPRLEVARELNVLVGGRILPGELFVIRALGIQIKFKTLVKARHVCLEVEFRAELIVHASEICDL